MTGVLSDKKTRKNNGLYIIILNIATFLKKPYFFFYFKLHLNFGSNARSSFIYHFNGLNVMACRYLDKNTSVSRCKTCVKYMTCCVKYMTCCEIYMTCCERYMTCCERYMTCEIYDFCLANIILNRRQRLVSGQSCKVLHDIYL